MGSQTRSARPITSRTISQTRSAREIESRTGDRRHTEQEMFPNERKLQQLQQQRTLVEQLRREANITRISVSQACQEIQKYCVDHQAEDFLLKGFASQKQNPFR